MGMVLAMTARAGLTPVDLQCDYTTEPMGVDSAAPRLSWRLEGGQRGARQTAYEIVATPYEKGLTEDVDVWDTGKVDSDATMQIPMT